MIGWAIGFVGGFGAGVGTLLYVARRHDRLAQPYRWVCPEQDCEVRVKSNDSTTVLRFADKHTQDHT